MIKALSLCDGISCGLMALDALGIECEYHAVEIDKYPRQISDHNFGDRIKRIWHDVTAITKHELKMGGPYDLVIMGPECQKWSVAGKGGGDEIFLRECLKILRWAQEDNPKLKFLIENVKMKKELLGLFTALVGVRPILVNSKNFSAQKRQRYYWCNFYVEHKIGTGKDANNLLEAWADKRMWVPFVNNLTHGCSPYLENGEQRLYGYSSSGRGVKGVERRLTNDGKALTLTTSEGCGGSRSKNLVLRNEKGAYFYRGLTVRECARLQGIPDSFDFPTSKTQSYKAIGNGWQIDTIKFILEQM